MIVVIIIVDLWKRAVLESREELNLGTRDIQSPTILGRKWTWLPYHTQGRLQNYVQVGCLTNTCNLVFFGRSSEEETWVWKSLLRSRAVRYIYIYLFFIIMDGVISIFLLMAIAFIFIMMMVINKYNHHHCYSNFLDTVSNIWYYDHYYYSLSFLLLLSLLLIIIIIIIIAIIIIFITFRFITIIIINMITCVTSLCKQ